MSSRAVLFVIAFLTWCLLSWPPDVQHLVIGLVVSSVVPWLVGDLFLTRPHLLRQPMRFVYFLGYYLPVFLWECFKANLDVAYRVISPRLPIKPGIVKIQTTLKSDTGLTFLANSITLTPGTMSVDIDKENSVLYVHWINVQAEDVESATRLIAGRFEKILHKIFE